MTQFEFNFGEKILKVNAYRVGHKLWIHVNGETYEISLEAKKARRAGSGAASDSGELLAPMPGKITAVNFQPNDKVEKGQVIAVMEAMKMEYTLKAGTSGTIKTVNVKVGDQVPHGHLIAEIL